MANPTLSAKREGRVEAIVPNDHAKRLFQAVYREQKKTETDDGSPKIKVSSLISRMSFFYEKIRNSVEYKDEHLQRKNAIERILKREIVIQGVIRQVHSAEVAHNLLTDLIRADYLPNNKLPETKIDDVAAVIDKYIALRHYALQHTRVDFQGKQDLTNWILSMAACDIEELFGRREVTDVVIKYMFDMLVARIELPDTSEHEKDKEIQIFLSIHRNWLKFDRDMLGYLLLKFYNGTWKSPSQEDVIAVARRIIPLRNEIERQLDHPFARQIDRVVLRYTVFFTIFLDVIEEDPVAVYNYLKHDPKAFPRAVKRVCEKLYKAKKSKLWRAGVRSIIYIFLTKMIVALILEIPVASLLGEQTSALSLFINIAFPPFLLFLVIFFTRLPGDANTAKIVEGINEIMVAPPEKGRKFKLRESIARSGRLQAVFTAVYGITFILSFGFVIYVLRAINFSLVSTVLFLFFLTLVSFFSIRIRKGTGELFVVEPTENIITLLGEFFYTPILVVGKFLSENFSRINVFIFILDFIIEAPFKVLVEVADEWSKYVKERREEIG